jgi:fatty acyl-CoA reductase
LKTLYPDFKSKLVAVQGDLAEPDLGISSEDREILIKNVNIVFHSAATVRFDEPLK